MAARCLLVLCCTLAAVTAQLASVNMDGVVQNLAQKFEDIKNGGLGIDLLEVSL